jgi:NDP-sugar pyrophosphorylase family protein
MVDSSGGVIRGFRSMPAPDCPETPLMFTGIQILEPEIFAYIPRGVFSHSTTDVYPKAIAEGRTIAAHVGHGKWFELSTLKRYLEISLTLLAETGEENYIGRNCTVSSEAQVSRSILWDNVVVEAGANLHQVVLADGVQIGSGETIENAVVVQAQLVAGKARPEKSLVGELHGNNFVVPVTR